MKINTFAIIVKIKIKITQMYIQLGLAVTFVLCTTVIKLKGEFYYYF